MSSFLESLSKIIGVINPLLLFIVFISIISFLSYLRIKCDIFFKNMEDISKNIEKLANSETNNFDSFYK